MLLSCLELPRHPSVESEAVAIRSHVVEVYLRRRGQRVGQEECFGRVSHVLTEAQRRNEKRALTRSASDEVVARRGSGPTCGAVANPRKKRRASTPCCR